MVEFSKLYKYLVVSSFYSFQCLTLVLMGESLVVHQKSMLERKVLGIGKDETNLSFGSSISHPLFEDDTFENLMKGA